MGPVLKSFLWKHLYNMNAKAFQVYTLTSQAFWTSLLWSQLSYNYSLRPACKFFFKNQLPNLALLLPNMIFWQHVPLLQLMLGLPIQFFRHSRVVFVQYSFGPAPRVCVLLVISMSIWFKMRPLSYKLFRVVLLSMKFFACLVLWYLGQSCYCPFQNVLQSSVSHSPHHHITNLLASLVSRPSSNSFCSL